MRRADESRLVYSTESGRICPECRKALTACACAANKARNANAAREAAARPGGAGAVRVGLESKGRGGKTVTVVRGLPLADAALADLGKRLRSACGTGGTSKDGVLELQGDHRDRVLELLAREGVAAKRTGPAG